MKKLSKKIAKLIFGLSLLCLVTGLGMITALEIRKAQDRRQQLKQIAEFENTLELLKEHSTMDHTYTGWSGHEDGDTLAILELPRLNIKVSVTEGIDKNALRIGAGHFEGDMPGEGNFAIAGHSSRIYTCLFNDIHKAEIGDEIFVRSGGGEHKYIISSMDIVSPDAVEYVAHVNESVITIVTCIKDGTKRLIVRGIEAGV